ncbi:GTP-binding protein [Oscillatoria sp. CS-180]|uniref:YcjF family protein n=1 Tax=Oscillatoria sp. CS-180 TaxID=3021720 RepID=UPI00232EA125|nr:GTP-binding protein [Oscillatoria sp. CS-180]MDB9526473.1 GTP-binding protein [Oscillatoria sp. CS-180]
MKQVRLVFIGIAVVFVVGALLWLVDFVLRIQAAIAYWSPLLSQIFLVSMILLAVAVTIAGVYYLRPFLRPRRKTAPSVPSDKKNAAAVAIAGVEQQVAQIQDEVAQTALEERLRTLSNNWQQRDIRIVLFGVGSVGKTSIVNGLLGDWVGSVDAPMGTTTVAATYPLRLPNIDTILWLTDTPGLLEASEAGQEREAQVRHLAAEADLLLFVIDDDLRQSEYALARSLLDMGKRLIIVLNKADLYTEEDFQTILRKVRSRFQSVLTPEDVVDVVANPQPLRLATGELAQMEADLWPLEKRLTEVLRDEGADLLADSILLRSQRLSEEARTLIQAQRRTAADVIVERYQWINAAVVAATPLPGVDLLATAAINAQMVVELGRVYQFDLSIEEGKELAYTLARTLTGLGIVKGAMSLLTLGMQTTLPTAIASRGVQGISAAYLTRIAGKSFMDYFSQNQDWGDGGVGEVVQKQFQLNRREQFVREFVTDAIAHLRDEVTVPLDLPIRDWEKNEP